MTQCLVFHKLTLDRFRSFDEPVIINLSKLGIGLHYLRGVNEDNARLDSNGVGKSSIWDGLLWTCYGKTSAGLKNTDISPWNGAKSTKGIVEFSIDDTMHKIERRANPNGLLLDGRDVGQPAIDRILGFSFSVCTHAIIFGQGRPLFFDLEPKRKLELFDEVLGLERWLVRSERASKLLAKRQQIESRLMDDIDSNKREQENLKSLKDGLHNHAKEWERERNSKISDIESRLDGYRKRRDKLMIQRDNADLALDQACTELKLLRTDISKAERRYDQLAERMNGYKVKVQVAKQEIIRLKQLKSMKGNCPTCGQPIRRNDHQHLDADIDKLSTIQIPQRVLDSVTDAQHLIDRLRDNQRTHEDGEADARHILDQITPELASLTVQVSTAETALKDHAEDNNPYNKQASEYRTRLGDMDQELIALISDLKMIRRKVERAKFWVSGFKEVRLYIINEVLQELEMATNVILDSMGLVDWECRYDVEKETNSGKVSRMLHVTILSPANKKTVRWEVWSGGEAQRLKLAGSMALAEVLLNHAGLSTNLEVFDEPSRGMSRAGITDLCDFLSERAARLNKAIFLTDHHALSTGRFKNVLTMIKDRKGSYLAKV